MLTRERLPTTPAGPVLSTNFIKQSAVKPKKLRVPDTSHDQLPAKGLLRAQEKFGNSAMVLRKIFKRTTFWIRGFAFECLKPLSLYLMVKDWKDTFSLPGSVS